MPHIDPFSILIFSALSALLMSAGLFAVGGGYFGEIKGIRRWAIALILQGIGWLWIALIHTLPVLEQIGAGSSFILLSLACYFHALVEFKEKDTPVRWAYYLVAVAYIAQTWLFVVEHNAAAKMSVIAIVSVILQFAIVYILLAKQKKKPPVIQKLTAYTFAIWAMVMLIHAFVNPEHLVTFQVTRLQDITYLSFSLMVVTSFGFILMCNEKYVAEQKLARLAEQELSERLQKIANRVPGMVYQFRLNADGSSCFPYASSVIQDIYRVTPEEVQNCAEKVFALLHPDDYDSVASSIMESAQHLTPWKQEYRVRFENGDEHWLLGNALPECEADGAILWHGFITDITERKQTEAKLRASEQRFQLLVEKIPIALILANHNDEVLYLNEHFKNLIGYTTNDIPSVEQWWLQAYPEENYRQQVQATWATAVNKAARDNTTIEALEYHVTCKDNIIRTLLISGIYLQDSRIITFMDITEQNRIEQQLRDHQEFTASILDSLPAHIVVLDPQGYIISVNQAWKRFVQLNSLPNANPAETDVTGWNYLEGSAKGITEKDREIIEILDGTKSVLTGVEKYFHTEYPCHSPTEKRWFHMTVSPLQNLKGGVVISHENITERKLAETELRIAATVFESQEGMMIADADKRILSVNQAFTRLTGYSADEVIGKNPRFLYSGKHEEEFYNSVWQNIADTGEWQGEIWNKRKNGDIAPEQMTITAVKTKYDEITHYVATFTDITERKIAEERINRLAFYDTLTQLPNRRLLYDRINHGIDIYRRTGQQMAVLMMDLDKFKAVNDKLGHAAGDELLKQVAERVKNRLREVDTVARLGGDEFVILIENVTDFQNLARIADAIIDALSQPFILYERHKAHIGASIGIAIFPEHGNDIELLMDNADIALYHAKNQGRGCFAYFSEQLTKKASERFILEARLRRAVEKQQLQVYFQPQIDIKTGQIIGAEALVRWHDPVHGHITPDKFIPIAEQSGAIIALGEWVLRETCRIGRQWLDQGLPAIRLAVNVSPYQFGRCDMNALVKIALKETGFPAQYLELEITETAIMDNREHAMSILNNLHKQGIRLAIDDFGTGYSSLASLKYLPLDVLKIDKTFIDDIPSLQDDMVITSTIIAMAHHLGFNVLAEGVETQDQLTFLREQGCDSYQGYLYSKPVPASDFAKLLAPQ
jgi:diguanylate cyclase (GGDEF)-like protein/PAS domain S-box-containing protein